MATSSPTNSSGAFSATTTSDDIISQWGHLIKDKNVFITGASSGIGAEAAKCFGVANANVYLAGRDIIKTNKVAEEIKLLVSDPSKIHTIELDLSDIGSVRKCIQEFLSLNVHLDILLNNAGCMALQERTLSVNKLEIQMATNHFGHFELTNGFLHILNPHARIINVSSMAHFRSPILFDDIHFETTPYEPWKAYGQSKTANILHAVELHKRYHNDQHGNIVAVSLHPGVIETELWRHATTSAFTMNKTIPQGAATSMYCALCLNIASGAYYNDCAEAPSAPYAIDAENAAKLWDVSVATLASI